MSTIATVIGLTAAACTTAAKSSSAQEGLGNGSDGRPLVENASAVRVGFGALDLLRRLAKGRRHYVGQRYQPSDFKCDSVFEGFSTAH